jgi:hypothetical protein
MRVHNGEVGEAIPVAFHTMLPTQTVVTQKQNNKLDPSRSNTLRSENSLTAYAFWLGWQHPCLDVTPDSRTGEPYRLAKSRTWVLSGSLPDLESRSLQFGRNMVQNHGAIF